MATIQELSAALVKADAAGNMADAKALADAIRAMQTASNPGARLDAGHVAEVPVNPMASNLPGALGQFSNTLRASGAGIGQGASLGWGDELLAGLFTPIELGINAVQGKPFDIPGAYQQALERGKTADAQEQALNPTAYGTGEVMGGLATIGKAPAGVSVTAAPLTTRQMIAQGLKQGAAYGGVYGAGKAEGGLHEKVMGGLTGAAFGAATGAALPLLTKKAGDLIEGFLQNRATAAAIKNAPKAADLKADSRALFQAVDQSGVTVENNKFTNFVVGLLQTAKRDRINPTLDPKASAAYAELADAVKAIPTNGPLTISDIHTLRQIAQKAAVSSEGRDAMFANRIVEGLDNFIGQSGNLVMPPGQQGTAAGNELLKAISTWGRARRVGLIEEAIYKAGNQASGIENGLRTQFRALLQNPKTRNQFSKAEIQAIESVANGTATSNIARLLGKFGFGGGSASNMLGGTIGFGAGSLAGGPIAGIAAALLGTGARKLSGVMANRAAERAANVVATPNIPNIALGRLPVLPGGGAPLTLPFLTGQQTPQRQ